MKRLTTFYLSTLAVLAIGPSAPADIEPLTLSRMCELIDGAVDGVIVRRYAFRVDHPVDGPELYFTTLTLEGTSLVEGQSVSIDVTYAGGITPEGEGVFNSVAPPRDDVKLGQRVVVFYRWTDDMGGEVSANALIAARGGLYRVVEGPSGPVVLGRGGGHAVERNQRLGDLQREVRERMTSGRRGGAR